MINKKELIEKAKEAALENFCCNHSNFTVGTALLTKSGKIYKGFNVENDGIQSICGERSAFVNALLDGEKEFLAIAIVGKNEKDKLFTKTVPCGYCRQFMSEYATKELIVYTYDDETEEYYEYTLAKLLPESFGFESK